MSHEPSHESKELGHEPIAISVRAVAVALAVLFATVLVALLLMGGLVMFFSHLWQAEPVVGPVDPRIPPPAGVPAVTADQPELLRRLRAREHEMLTSYGWVDREAGVARIPIRRAMEILAQEQQPDTNAEPPNDNQAL